MGHRFGESRGEGCDLVGWALEDVEREPLRGALAAGFAHFDGALKAYEFDTALEKLQSACAAGGIKL